MNRFSYKTAMKKSRTDNCHKNNNNSMMTLDKYQTRSMRMYHKDPTRSKMKYLNKIITKI